MALAVAANVSVDVATSSPGSRSSSSIARCRAAVPLESATACSTPIFSANSRSKASTCGPMGAIQFESNASSSNSGSCVDM